MQVCSVPMTVSVRQGYGSNIASMSSCPPFPLSGPFRPPDHTPITYTIHLPEMLFVYRKHTSSPPLIPMMVPDGRACRTLRSLVLKSTIVSAIGGAVEYHWSIDDLHLLQVVYAATSANVPSPVPPSKPDLRTRLRSSMGTYHSPASETSSSQKGRNDVPSSLSALY